MKLTISGTSPYARKVRMAVIEKGLESRIEEVVVNVMQEHDAARAANPLGKVPGLVLDDGAVLFDSPLLCEYIDSLSPDPLLVPASGAGRWEVLRIQALADGVMDAAVSMVFQKGQTDAPPSEFWRERWTGAIGRAVVELDRAVAGFGAAFDLGQISAVCAVDYLDLRHPTIDWRREGPALAAWRSGLPARRSIAATAP